MKRNLIKFMKDKCKVLHLGCENIMQPCSLAADWVESRFAEEELTNKKLARSQKFTHVVKTNHTLCCIGWSTKSRPGGGSFHSVLLRLHLG